MIINSPEVKKTVIDYDIVLDFGMTLPLTIDASKGDTIDISDTRVQAHITPRPTIGDPDKLTATEDVTIFVSHIVSIQRREREVIELSPEEKAEQTKFLKTWGTIQ